MPDDVYLGYLKKNSETYGKNLSKSITTNQSEIKNPELEITIYPNPATQAIIISLSEHTENAFYEIYNLTGRKLQRDKITPEKQNISLKNYCPGIYFQKISDGEKIYTKKFVKE